MHLTLHTKKTLSMSKQEAKKASETLKQMTKTVSSHTYDSFYASLNAMTDADAIKKVNALVKKKSQLKPTIICVIGIGGSNLGTMAVQQAITGKLYNETHPKTRIYYADTTDTQSLIIIKKLIDEQRKQNKSVIINIISKSGGTTETIANAEILTRDFSEDEIKKYVVITTDKESKLWHLAQEKHIDVLEIPKLVGGRYSVLSPVGLFPLALIGIDIKKLCAGAQQMRDTSLRARTSSKNMPLQSALFIYDAYKKGAAIHDTFIFANDLEGIGKWYRQLMAESIGKEFNIKNKRVYNGMTPTCSIGSTDLHSMAQLYLGGPYDKCTTFVSVKNQHTTLTINTKKFISLAPDIEKKRIDQVMDAILGGVLKAFDKGKRKYVHMQLDKVSEQSIGEILQCKMMEIMFLAAFMDVNAFDQPNVEDYKKETRALLKR